MIQIRNLVSIFLTTGLSLVLLSCGGKNEDDALWLLALGGGSGESSPSSISTSPTDAGGGDTSAPATVSDPLQAEAEAILGFSLDGNWGCTGYSEVSVIDTSRIDACIYKSGNAMRVRWYPVYISGPQSFLSNYKPAADCAKYGTGVSFTEYRNNAVVQYAWNQCLKNYKVPVIPAPKPAPEPKPAPAPTPEPSPNPQPSPAPTPDPAPMELSSWRANFPHPQAGMVYPETAYFAFIMSENLPCDSLDYYNQVKDWIQLWERQSDGSWTRRLDVYPTCGLPRANVLYLNLKHPDNLIGYVSPFQNFALNESVLKPNTEYRILLSKDIYSLPEPVSGKPRQLSVFNTLGDLAPNPGQWSGLAFRTDSEPCFASYADRWSDSETTCNYSKVQTNASGDMAVKRLGCAIFTGPQSRNANPPDCNASSLFPDVAGVPNMEIGDFGPCEDPLTRRDMACINDWNSPQCQKKILKKGACIVHAGQPNEFVRIYYNLDSASLDNCQGLKRPEGIEAVNLENLWGSSLKNSWGYDLRTNYARLRRAGCDASTGGSNPPPKPDPNCKNTVTLDTSGGRWFTTPEGSYTNAKGRRVKIKGIHTYWQKQALGLNVHACQDGWYRLAVRARNHAGPKPDFYGAFHLNIDNKADGREYGISIPASDERYYTRGTFVYLKKGNNSLVANWTNDAYKKGVYDANIQIRAVRIRPYNGVPIKLSKIWRAGRNFCKTEGRFFGSGRSIYTDQTGNKAHYCFEGLEPGHYRLIVRGKNKGTLPEGLANFRVRVQLNGSDTGIMEIPASDVKYRRGVLEFNIYGSKTDLALSWTNPHAAVDGNKARFELRALRLKKLGPVTESALAAYLKSASMLRIGMVLLLSLLALGGALLWRRRYS